MTRIVVTCTESPNAEVTVSYYLSGVDSPSLCVWIVPGTLYGL